MFEKKTGQIHPYAEGHMKQLGCICLMSSTVAIRNNVCVYYCFYIYCEINI